MVSAAGPRLGAFIAFDVLLAPLLVLNLLQSLADVMFVRPGVGALQTTFHRSLTAIALSQMISETIAAVSITGYALVAAEFFFDLVRKNAKENFLQLVACACRSTWPQLTC